MTAEKKTAVTSVIIRISICLVISALLGLAMSYVLTMSFYQIIMFWEIDPPSTMWIVILGSILPPTFYQLSGANQKASNWVILPLINYNTSKTLKNVPCSLKVIKDQCLLVRGTRMAAEANLETYEGGLGSGRVQAYRKVVDRMWTSPPEKQSQFFYTLLESREETLLQLIYDEVLMKTEDVI